MTKKKRKQKKPLTNGDKIMIAALIFDVVRWLVELLRK